MNKKLFFNFFYYTAEAKDVYWQHWTDQPKPNNYKYEKEYFSFLK